MDVRVHSARPEDELLTLTNRILAEVPQPTERGQSLFARSGAVLGRSLLRELGPVEPWTRAQSAQHFIKRKGWGLYGPAWLSLGGHPLSKKDMEVSLFLKAEKWPVRAGELLKAARAIQFRGPRYNIELGRFLLPMEELLWSKLQPGMRVRDDVWLFSSKGLTPAQRAEQVAGLWHKYPGGRALCLDHSRFDAHLSENALKTEHGVYMQVLGKGRFLRWLLGGSARTKASPVTAVGTRSAGVGVPEM